jgi:WS/DGAT/MGAT family acyltransferase
MEREMTLKAIAPLDLIWLLMETPEGPAHVGALLEFRKPRGRPDVVREIVASYRSHRPVPPFSYVPHLSASAMPHFREAQDYDPYYHVQHLALPAGATREDALRLVTDLHEPVLDRARPLFRTWVIDGLPDDTFAVYTKMHHAIVDGVNAARHIQASLGKRPRQEIPPPPFAVKLAARKTRLPKSLDERLLALAATAKDQARALGDLSLGAVRRRVHELLGDGHAGTLAARVVPSPTNGPLHMARSSATLSLPFETMHEVARRHGATLNDLCVTIVDHAVHGYLRETGRAFTHRLVAMLPMSLRSEEDTDSGTKASAMFPALGDHGASAHERLRQVIESVSAAKQEMRSMSRDAAMLYAVTRLGIAALASATRADRLTSPLANLVISNVPGDRTPAYLNGAALVGVFPISAIAAGVGLNVTLTSSQDRMDFGFVGNGVTLRGLSRLAELTRAAFEELQGRPAAASPRRRSPAQRRSTRPSARKPAPSSSPRDSRPRT